MALEHMFDYLKTEAQKDIDQQINSAKVEMTRGLVDLGDSLEEMYQQKNNTLSNQLQKKEIILKTEKDYQYKIKLLEAEKTISDQMLELIYAHLSNFPDQNPTQYHKVIKSWFQKARDVISAGTLTVQIREGDLEFFKSHFPDVSTVNNSLIKGGFILINDAGETIDLSFDTLFHDRKQQILQSSMQIVKETL